RDPHARGDAEPAVVPRLAHVTLAVLQLAARRVGVALLTVQSARRDPAAAGRARAARPARPAAQRSRRQLPRARPRDRTDGPPRRRGLPAARTPAPQPAPQ